MMDSCFPGRSRKPTSTSRDNTAPPGRSRSICGHSLIVHGGIIEYLRSNLAPPARASAPAAGRARDPPPVALAFRSPRATASALAVRSAPAPSTSSSRCSIGSLADPMLAAHVGYPGATLRLPQRAQNLLLGMSFLRPPFPEACLKETEFKAKLKVYEDFI